MIYGALPEDLGLIDLSPVEMMFWQYLPIKAPRKIRSVPDNLQQFTPIIEAVAEDCVQHGRWVDSYVYLTAKTLWVQGDYVGNRPGWHSDGFGTDDINYIWCDRAPTEFYVGPTYELPDDCADAMRLMELRALGRTFGAYENKHLLKLTPAVIHRSPVGFAPGMRTFVKVSVSKDRYNLQGNSINHGLGENWPLVPRQAERNHPAVAA